MLDSVRKILIPALAVLLCLFTLLEVNFPRLQSQSQLALFVMLGLMLCFLVYPIRKKWEDSPTWRAIDFGLFLAVGLTCGYVFVQTEPMFDGLWSYGKSLGDRAGIETRTDIIIGALGLLLVLEGTRRSIGWVVPLLAMLFMAHSFYCYAAAQGGLSPMPAWLLPHAGQDVDYLVSATFAQSLGVFGPAAGVMFKYVFLFVVFGSFLEMSGATQFIIDFAEKCFGSSPGGPAKVSVLGSGLMGSLSGSAVANAVTTGSFTIPMMRNAGFERHVAGGITAAAASGGALVPPVMGAGAYMMLELVQPQVRFLDIVKAALIPAILYYFSIFLIVHFYARRIGTKPVAAVDRPPISSFQGLVFFAALGTLVVLLMMGFTAFKAVSGSLVVILVLSMLSPRLEIPRFARMTALAAFVAVLAGHQLLLAEPPAVSTLRLWIESYLNSALLGMFGLLLIGLIHSELRGHILGALEKAAKNGVSLVAAAACVGIIIGIVQSTGIATDFSAVIKGMVESSLLLALIGIMLCSIVLGMGVPSVVCYLLMATLMGSLLEEMGVQPLAAHLFIFYFGMMSMVTPPVALAAYASASLAESPIMKTALAAFRFALVGFTLPFMFVYRPALLLLAPRDMTNRGTALATANQPLDLSNVNSLIELSVAVGTSVVGIIALAASIAGFLGSHLSMVSRAVLLVAAAMLLSPYVKIADRDVGLAVNIVGGALFALMAIMNWRSRGVDSQEAVS
jgi:TRAP transporter 4TM/12TM fusion protein